MNLGEREETLSLEETGGVEKDNRSISRYRGGIRTPQLWVEELQQGHAWPGECLEGVKESERRKGIHVTVKRKNTGF